MQMRVDSRPKKRAGYWKRLVRHLRLIGRVIAFATFYWGWKVAKHFVTPAVMFAVYGEERHQRAYWPAWVHRRLRPAFPIGLIRFGRGWGIIVASKQSAEAFERDPRLVLGYLDAIRREVPRSGPVALAGRLPTWVLRAGGSIRSPFVDGALGTRFAMRAAILRGAGKLDVPTQELCLALLGGAGRIGSQLSHDMSGDFSEVIAFDPRYEVTERSGTIVRTAEYPQLQRANVILVLTGKGEDVAPAVPHFAQGTVLVDDTHPDIPPPLRKELAKLGVVVLKAVTADGCLKMIPRLPGFRGDSIPGCLVEALVVAHYGWSVVISDERFFEAARELGFMPQLIEHPGGE